MQAKGIAPGDLLNALAPAERGDALGHHQDRPVRSTTCGPTARRAPSTTWPTSRSSRSTAPPSICAMSPASADGFSRADQHRAPGRPRGVLISVLKSGNASTLDVVKGIRGMLAARAEHRAAAIEDDAAGGSDRLRARRGAGRHPRGHHRRRAHRAHDPAVPGQLAITLIIAISIPLSILTSIIVLSLIGETINIMTLGGLALAVGILVDDATVTIENIERYLEKGTPLREAILEGAAQIAVPALVSTLCICIVFLPMFFLGGVARYLFVPLAEAVVFAMLASYILSRTLVPTLAMYLLRAKEHGAAGRAESSAAFSAASSAASSACARAYQSLLDKAGLPPQAISFPAFLLALPAAPSSCSRSWGRTSSPAPTAASSSCTCARNTGTAHRRDGAAVRPGRRQHPQADSRRARSTTSSTTSACPTAPSNTQHLTNGTIGRG